MVLVRSKLSTSMNSYEHVIVALEVKILFRFVRAALPLEKIACHSIMIFHGIFAFPLKKVKQGNAMIESGKKNTLFLLTYPFRGSV